MTKDKPETTLKAIESGSPACSIESDGKDIFVVFNGVRIAKRGHFGTPQAKTWISLEPGYEVCGIKKIEVLFNGAAIH